MSYLVAISLFVCLFNAYVFKGPAFANGPVPTCPKQAFEQFNEFYDKSHDTEVEKQQRYDNFLASTKEIEQFNRERPLGPNAYFHHTQFSDMSQAEFMATMNGLKPDDDELSTPVAEPEASRNGTIPAVAIDWVARGMTTPIKNQGKCGSCWAFSAVETVESANLMAGNPVGAQPGSPQELVDCVGLPCMGCKGGRPRYALNWIKARGGLELEKCYPYHASTSSCVSKLCKNAYTVRTVNPVLARESHIYDILAQYGPLSIAVDAHTWKSYGGGVVSAACGTTMNHAVQLVGYSPQVGGYWVVRNSWGADWGNAGHIYIQYGGNVCGIRQMVTVATARNTTRE